MKLERSSQTEVEKMKAELSHRLAKVSGTISMMDGAKQFWDELPKVNDFKDFSPNVQQMILKAEIQRADKWAQAEARQRK